MVLKNFTIEEFIKPYNCLPIETLLILITMKTKKLIINLVKRKGSVKSSDVVTLTGISRQSAAEHLRDLVKVKKLLKLGSTNSARYIPYSKKIAIKYQSNSKYSGIFFNKDLNEDTVFQEATLKIGLKKSLPSDVYQIAYYAFTEMLNNAIDHSKSLKSEVLLNCLDGKFEFRVIDKGIGVFESIRKKFKLATNFGAVEHLLKGKQTTDPKRHSGQGIFFTSKIADKFVLESGKLRLVINNALNDIALEDIKKINGTRVYFSIKQKSRKSIRKLFDEYQDDDYEFDKTKITIHLSEKQGEHISRSEAKRLLFGLEKFKRIILDFKKIKGIGQGFADEIFRVYQNSYPEVQIEAINMSPSVEFMVRRAKK